MPKWQHIQSAALAEQSREPLHPLLGMERHTLVSTTNLRLADSSAENRSETEFRPDRAVIRRPLHSPDIVGYARTQALSVQV